MDSDIHAINRRWPIFY